jgi:tRNA (guanine-N7-)-methyltransferase
MKSSPYPHRRIKSFARCSGRMTPAQKEAVDTVLPQYLWSAAKLAQPQPLILDIGFGMGHSLAWQAEKYPQYHFLGAEVFLPGATRLATLLQEKQLSNVDIAVGDVVFLLIEELPEQCLTGVQIFFPDPWPKKRHNKRRLLQVDFLDKLLSCIKPGGFIHFASDWADYCQHARSVLTQDRRLCLQGKQEVLMRPQTRYEARGIAQGYAIEDIVVWLPEQDSNL